MSKQPPLMQALAGVAIGVALLFAFGQIKTMPFLSVVAGSDTEEPVKPIVVTDRTEQDLGEVRSGDALEATFEIRNLGGSRLILRKTNGDCDCMSTTEAAVIVEPGGCRTVVAKLDTNKVSGLVKIGVHYQTNDPQRPRLSLFTLANIVTLPNQVSNSFVRDIYSQGSLLRKRKNL